MNSLDALTAHAAHEAGIPDTLVPSVVERARVARDAVQRFTGYGVYGGALMLLARRVVQRAVQDHEAGVLERRC